MNERQRGQSFPFGFALVAALAVVFYVATLVDALTMERAGFEEALATGFAALFLTAALWATLAGLLLIGGLKGEMPRGGALAAIPLVPVSGVAALIGLIMCSGDLRWPAFFPATLALLLAFYAFWARFPRLRAALPGKVTSFGVWGAVFVLSAAAFAAVAIG
jgi:hypothetical protein